MKAAYHRAWGWEASKDKSGSNDGRIAYRLGRGWELCSRERGGGTAVTAMVWVSQGTASP